MNTKEQTAITNRLWNDPMGFLKAHLLIYKVDNIGFGAWNQSVANKIAPGTGHRPLYFDIHEATGMTVSGTDGKKGRYFYVGPSQSGSQIGYFLPWDADGGYNLILGKDAFFFFNALMDGCGFGCIPGPSGSLKVAHHNIQCQTNGTSHTAMTASLAGYSATMNRNSYRWNSDEAEGKCSIIGIRGRLSGWWVIAQRFSMDYNGKVRILSVDRLV